MSEQRLHTHQDFAEKCGEMAGHYPLGRIRYVRQRIRLRLGQNHGAQEQCDLPAAQRHRKTDQKQQNRIG